MIGYDADVGECEVPGEKLNGGSKKRVTKSPIGHRTTGALRTLHRERSLLERPNQQPVEHSGVAQVVWLPWHNIVAVVEHDLGNGGGKLNVIVSEKVSIDVGLIHLT